VTEQDNPVQERPAFPGWVPHDADEADAHAALTELPPPARLVYRHIIRPRYEARRHRTDRQPWQTAP
jgi:hypothetical protein